MEEKGPHSFAGIFVPILSDNQMLSPDVSLTCPAQGRIAAPRRSVHELEELYEKQPDEFHQIARKLAGSYAYSLGYRDGSGYHGFAATWERKISCLSWPTVSNRSVSPVARTTAARARMFSSWAATCGSAPSALVGINGDDIYINWDHRVLAGKAREDTVLGPSDASPTPRE